MCERPPQMCEWPPALPSANIVFKFPGSHDLTQDEGAHQGAQHEAENGDTDGAPDMRAAAGVALRRALLALVEQLVDGERNCCAYRQRRVRRLRLPCRPARQKHFSRQRQMRFSGSLRTMPSPHPDSIWPAVRLCHAALYAGRSSNWHCSIPISAWDSGRKRIAEQIAGRWEDQIGLEWVRTNNPS